MKNKLNTIAKYENYSREDLIETIAEKNKTIARLNGEIYSNKNVFNKYTDDCLRTFQKEKTEQENASMLCMGIAGEAGEIVDYLKKVYFHRHSLDKEILIKEIGDLMWYLAILTNFYNISMNEVLSKNIQKLRERYPNGFNSHDSIARVDEAE